jgi:sporulation protein YlmC with PRC-barrel domain
MLVEFTDLLGRPVITERGLQLGTVYNVIIDMNKHTVYELLISETNPDIVEEGHDIAVPWRWIQSVDNVVVLRYFPGRIRLKPQMDEEPSRRRKQRKIKPQFGEGGISRQPWS